MTRSPDPTGDSFAERLRQEYGDDADPAVSLEPDADAAPDRSPTGSSSDLLRRLADSSLKGSRYRLLGEIARGGMGAILKVWDGDLRRTLAMKVILGKEDATADVAATPVDSRTLGRFLEEAQVTGQLDHPGIAPVHELGLDSDGRVYFTMKLVKGRDLKQVFNLVFEEKEGWNETRALLVMLKVCEAMAYAHSKGVIHRDLKPANVMVGAFGEVYVMDWGLAHVLGRKDRHDLRLRPEFGSSLSSVRTERRGERDDSDDSPLVTMDGDVMGTPAYMPPEQARGEVDQLSARSDVYAIGAMLYHLLARKMPYVPRGARVSSRTMLLWVLEGPPKPLALLRQDIPAELVAICDKAMARDAADRYPNTQSLAEDLRAYLEHRVVGAYETGTWAETKKWIERNRPLAAALAAGVLALCAGLVVMSSLKRNADSSAALAESRRILAERNERAAKEQEALAKREKANVLRLSAFQTLDDLVKEADELWPPEPALVDRYRGWLVRAESLAAKIPEFQNSLSEMEARALPSSASEDDRWWHAQMQKLVAALSAFADEEHGLLHGNSAEHGAGVALRLDFAQSIEARSSGDPRWKEALEAISRSEPYRYTEWPGGSLAPQLGLVPIGEDPASHLWEFAHLQSGEPPLRGADGRIQWTDDTGLVLVLIPGGIFTMGAQQSVDGGPNYDARARPDEVPPHRVQLSPYFLSKCEMTQGQWLRATSENPSQHLQGLRHPVEHVSWPDCVRVLARLGLSLPTEAQWENGCRGGTETVYWSGTDRETLRGRVNLIDQSAARAGAVWPGIQDWPDLDDGFVFHAPVGTFAANPYGLHEVHGNVWEWCADGYVAVFYTQSPLLDPLSPSAASGARVYRGGGFGDIAESARSSHRGVDATGNRSDSIGLRPARAVLPSR